MTNATESLIVCPPWCQTDHEEELAETIDRQEGILRWYDENYDRLEEMIGRPPSEKGRKPGEPITIEYLPIHRHLVGTVTVRTGSDESELGTLKVQLDSSDDWPTRVLLDEPHGWTEDYDPQEARALARLLVVAAEMIERDAQ